MTIQEAIEASRMIADTELEDGILVEWLSSLDGQLWNDVNRNYLEAGEMPEYDAPTDEHDSVYDTVLMVGPPYDDLYIDYLVMRTYLDHGDMDRYNARASLFNSKCQAWSMFYNRTHAWAAANQFDPNLPRVYKTVITF